MSEIVPYDETVSGEVLPPAASLDELIERANNEHRQVEESLGQALGHVIQCGLALSEVRERFIVGRGWNKWADEHFDGGRVMAASYMRMAEYRDLINDLPNVGQAMKRLQGMPAIRQPGVRMYSDAAKEEARVLFSNGMSKTEISKMFGVSFGTVASWVDPKVLQRQRKYSRERSKAKRAEEARKRQEAANRAAEREARRVGGALAEAYSLIHKLEAPLAKAEREATNPEAKKALEEAGSFQRRMLYRIVEALGAS